MIAPQPLAMSLILYVYILHSLPSPSPASQPWCLHPMPAQQAPWQWGSLTTLTVSSPFLTSLPGCVGQDPHFLHLHRAN